MTDEDKRQLRARLRRLEGQVRALEVSLANDEPVRFVSQAEAVVAAGKASLRFYVEKRLLSTDELSQTDRKMILRLIEKFS